MTVVVDLRRSGHRVSIKKRFAQLLKSAIRYCSAILDQITVVTGGSTSNK